MFETCNTTFFVLMYLLALIEMEVFRSHIFLIKLVK